MKISLRKINGNWDAGYALDKHVVSSTYLANVVTVLLACTDVLVAANKIESGIPEKISKVSNKSGDMFTYTIPYMISFFNFNLGDWKMLLSLFVFMCQ